MSRCHARRASQEAHDISYALRTRQNIARRTTMIPSQEEADVSNDASSAQRAATVNVLTIWRPDSERLHSTHKLLLSGKGQSHQRFFAVKRSCASAVDFDVHVKAWISGQCAALNAGASYDTQNLKAGLCRHESARVGVQIDIEVVRHGRPPDFLSCRFNQEEGTDNPTATCNGCPNPAHSCHKEAPPSVLLSHRFATAIG
jgi:hypothetical protein